MAGQRPPRQSTQNAIALLLPPFRVLPSPARLLKKGVFFFIAPPASTAPHAPSRSEPEQGKGTCNSRRADITPKNPASEAIQFQPPQAASIRKQCIAVFLIARKLFPNGGENCWGNHPLHPLSLYLSPHCIPQATGQVKRRGRAIPGGCGSRSVLCPGRKSYSPIRPMDAGPASVLLIF